MTTSEKHEGIYLRGRTWWLSYSGPRPDGSWGLVRESSGSSDPRAAEKLRKRRLQDAENHRRGIRKFQGPQQERSTVGELLDNLERYYETEKLKSGRQMKVHLEHVRDFFGFDRAVRVTRRRIEDYIAHRREQDAADATIDRETELLRRAFNLAAEDGLIAWVPKVPRLVKANANAKQGFVERADFEKFVTELPSPVLQDLAWWAYCTGMRRGEILALTWEGHDRETKTIRLHAKDAKTGRARAIALEGWPELAAVIDRRLKERRPGCPLIFHANGRKVGDFYTSWVRALERAEVRHFTIHDLRRTAVRNMVRAGVDRATAKLISGHRTDSMFDRYNIIDERDLAEAMAKRAVYEGNLAKPNR